MARSNDLVGMIAGVGTKYLPYFLLLGAVVPVSLGYSEEQLAAGIRPVFGLGAFLETDFGWLIVKVLVERAPISIPVGAPFFDLLNTGASQSPRRQVRLLVRSELDNSVRRRRRDCLAGMRWSRVLLGVES